MKIHAKIASLVLASIVAASSASAQTAYQFRFQSLNSGANGYDNHFFGNAQSSTVGLFGLDPTTHQAVQMEIGAGLEAYWNFGTGKWSAQIKASDFVTMMDAYMLGVTLPAGPKGDKGDTGSSGSPGAAATISVGTVTTGSAGGSVSVTNSGTSSAAVLDFTIPRGNTGVAGSAATVAVGTVTTGAAGSSASVTNAGSSSAATFNFTIPRGDTGADGKTVRNGSGTPSGGLGVDGDFYIDTTNKTIYGPKASGSWGSGVSYVGPTGSTGADGALSIQRTVGTIAGGAGRYTWTYATAFGSGVVPIITVTPVKPSGTASYNAQVIGTPTNTSCTIEILIVPNTITGILGTIGIVTPAADGTKVHLTAIAP